MDLSNYNAMDPSMLLGIINMKLRHECSSVDDLADCYDIDAGGLQQRLSMIGYHYDAIHNQFTAV
ncbi:DUF4250 domain-containing protein [Neiella sp. HB171785]|uniref:DUF4250 domain-containing protein n=2 Tax=Neiella TaxID=1434025 RepID=A0A8J6QVI7_9GAMM|nr:MULTISPECIES: DUF4250 domain-containing protein [Neiella]MBD1391372.1 DUF4250 domain-containing protein [Neiella litorisoli]MBW8192248.1 DUF4250 domain-containing protein [Neiella holothuriorum]